MIKRKDQKKTHQAKQTQTPSQEDKEQQDKEELLAKLQRVTADFLNYQKRMARNSEEVRLWAKAEMIKGLLPLVDDLEHALEAGKNAKDVESLLEGFRLVYQHLQDMLAKHQVEPIPTEKQKFDPAVHEAMLQQVSADHEPGTVIAELRRGYILDGRTLRPARVAVSRKPSDEEAEPAPEKSDQAADRQDIGETAD